MRLIDADKIVFTNCLVKSGLRVCCHNEGIVPKEDIEMQPTVKAIPIEFIKQLIDKFDCERGNAIKDTFAHILTGLLEFWEFEQEKENPVKISEGNYDSDEEYEEQMRCLDEN